MKSTFFDVFIPLGFLPPRIRSFPRELQLLQNAACWGLGGRVTWQNAASLRPPLSFVLDFLSLGRDEGSSNMPFIPSLRLCVSFWFSLLMVMVNCNGSFNQCLTSPYARPVALSTFCIHNDSLVPACFCPLSIVLPPSMTSDVKCMRVRSKERALSVVGLIDSHQTCWGHLLLGDLTGACCCSCSTAFVCCHAR